MCLNFKELNYIYFPHTTTATDTENYGTHDYPLTVNVNLHVYMYARLSQQTRRQ